MTWLATSLLTYALMLVAALVLVWRMWGPR